MSMRKNGFLWHNCFIFLLSWIIVGCVSIAKASITQNHCLNCHQELQANLALYAQQWTDSVHSSANIGCEDCHGGDPNFPYKPEIGKNGYVGVPIKREIPPLCDRCHANQRYMKRYNIRIDKDNLYKNSTHGRRLLEEGNMDVACCVDCHGSHDIKTVDDPQARANHFNIAETCARCHSNNNLMKPYGLPTDQLIRYRKSYHGQILYQKIEGKNPRLVPSCPGCHGIHSGRPSGVTKVCNACYNCHLTTKRYFEKSLHSYYLKANQRPRCVDCHGYHDIPHSDEDMFAGQEASHCGGCHPQNSDEYQIALGIRDRLLQAKSSMEKSQDKINRIKQDLDIDVTNLNRKMKDILDCLNEAMSATHSIDIQAVNEYVQKIQKYSNTIDRQIDCQYREIRRRKKWLVKLLITISLLISFIAYHRSKLKKAGIRSRRK